MKYIGTATTDVGISKKTNQDSVCVKVANTEKHGQVAMVVLCDGMGGLDKGELASATVIRAFSNWFENELSNYLNHISLKNISVEWERLIKEQNYRISQYGKKVDVSLGTTVTAMLIVDDKYLIAHVGDSRAYEITDSITQLTEDQTFIAREIKKGNMTPEQAAKDPRRNMLLQCVGASKNVVPQMIQGKVKENSVYMFCSDGFRHVLSNEEIYENFNPSNAVDIQTMAQNSRYLIDVVKSRKEKDNITVALLKCV
jgi:serine/threonine protein phosphatase PrpC